MNEQVKVTDQAVNDTKLDTPALQADGVKESAVKRAGSQDGRRQLLRCEECGASLVTFRADLLRYTRQGWPKCCGQTMVPFIEADATDEFDGTD